MLRKEIVYCPAERKEIMNNLVVDLLQKGLAAKKSQKNCIELKP